jgi:hypothetical protein
VRPILPQPAEVAILRFLEIIGIAGRTRIGLQEELLAGLNGLYERAEAVMVEHGIVAVKALRKMARRRLDSPLER